MVLTKQAHRWVGVAKDNLKVMPISNPDYFLMGTTYLDKAGFNKINDDENDYIHGVSVIYGPFRNEKEIEEFVSEYAGSEYLWPGTNDWKWFRFGQPFILTPMVNSEACKVVENKSLDFVGQLHVNEQQRRIEEIKKVKQAMREVELDTTKPIEPDELEQRISWIQSDIQKRKEALEGEEKHLAFLMSRRQKAPEESGEEKQ